MFLKVFLFLISLLCAKAWYFNPLDRNSYVSEEHSYLEVHDGKEAAREMVNEWTVVINGDEEVAQLVALELGYVYAGPVVGFAHTFIFMKAEHEVQRRTDGVGNHVLLKHRKIKWSEQMFVKLRVKRYPLPDQDLLRVKRLEDNQILEPVLQLEHSKRPIVKKRLIRLKKPLFNDELWSQEWYLQDTRKSAFLPRLDLNVLPVYAMGYNGSGIRVSILDDGIEHTHTDLRANYDAEISWDCNDRDPDPSPRPQDLQRNSHGTRCAGEIAMAANNKKCGVGVAWGAKVGGVRMLDGRITDRVEAEAIGYAWDKVDIYSASWGPNDDGSTVEGPGKMANEAMLRGIFKGRGGKGTIYVWANGNGGGAQDNCNCDGYSSSIYTISVGSASQQGRFPWYGEVCPSTLVAAYSSGAYGDQKIATTDTNNSCTLSHTGTSAAAPLAAGIIALALQANPNLTWRDVQHLIVWTSDYAPLTANPGWQMNGIGLMFDIRFGFGLLNAGALVTTARDWVNVPDKHVCRVAAPVDRQENQLASGSHFVIGIRVQEGCSVNYIEHVEVIVNIQYTRRGALEIFLTSPQGTKVQLLSPRPKDMSNRGFMNWSFMSVATWGENPFGSWKLSILDKTKERNYGYLVSLKLVIHGTNQVPHHMLSGPRHYDYEYVERGEEFEFEHNEGNINTKQMLPDQHDLEELADFIDLDPLNLQNVEQELLRYHHRILHHQNRPI